MDEIEAVDAAILVPASDARHLCDALVVFKGLLRGTGSRPTPMLEELYARLSDAVRESELRARATFSRPDPAPRGIFDHGLMPTAAAAEALGCSQANVRGLARRGALHAQRIGGRWMFDRRAVLDRAAARGC